jgi:hypothetical protein
VRLLRPRTEPASATPRTRLQVRLQRTVTRRYATNPWFMAGAGALVALGVGLALTAGCRWGAQRLATRDLLSAITGPTGVAEAIAYALTIVLELGTLDLFLASQGVPLIGAVSNPPNAQAGSVTTWSITLPVLGLLLVPGLALALGGYLSAASEYRQVPRYAIARGALVGPFYALGLGALAKFGADHPTAAPFYGENQMAVPHLEWALFYGLLWGALFGALGGWIQVSGRAWLTAILPVLRTRRDPRLGAALAGATVAFLLGILLLSALSLGVLAGGGMWFAPGISTVATTVDSSASTGLSVREGQTVAFNPAQVLALSVVTGAMLGPPVAVWSLTLGAGAAWETTTRSTFGAIPADHTSLGILGAQNHLPLVLWLALALAPLVSYFVGGRTAARTVGASRRDTAFLAGASIALPLAGLLALAALAVSMRNEQGSPNGMIITTVGPSVLGTALATIVGGALIGGLGGVSTTHKSRLAAVLPVLRIPAQVLAYLPFSMLDRLLGRDQSRARSFARNWLYAATMSVFVLGILTLGVIVATPRVAASTTYATLQLVVSILGGLLVAVPALCCVGAFVAAIVSPSGEPPSFGQPVGCPLYVVLPESGAAELVASLPAQRDA